MAIQPAPIAAGWRPDRPSTGGDLLVALADLQRHLDVLGEDLVAADRALAGWQGRAQQRFRHRLGGELHALAWVLAELRRVGVDVHDLLDRSPRGGGAGW